MMRPVSLMIKLESLRTGSLCPALLGAIWDLQGAAVTMFRLGKGASCTKLGERPGEDKGETMGGERKIWVG